MLTFPSILSSSRKFGTYPLTFQLHFQPKHYWLNQHFSQSAQGIYESLHNDCTISLLDQLLWVVACCHHIHGAFGISVSRSAYLSSICSQQVAIKIFFYWLILEALIQHLMICLWEFISWVKNCLHADIKDWVCIFR